MKVEVLLSLDGEIGRHEGLYVKLIIMYDNCKIYGPYLNNKDNRLRCIIVSPKGNKTTISYPKYLMELHIGRYLEEDETVDHIDGNPLK